MSFASLGNLKFSKNLFASTVIIHGRAEKSPVQNYMQIFEDGADIRQIYKRATISVGHSWCSTNAKHFLPNFYSRTTLKELSCS